MQFLIDVRTLLVGYRYFRRLFSVRLVSQFSDGIFQVALASYVLFSPERQPTAGGIAAGFAILLLPFSLLGPFCGVLLDRWSRRQVLLGSNLIRAALVLAVVFFVARGNDGPGFFALILACLSVNRFLLAALSAALPHVVPTERLVMANAVSPTCGTLAYLIGLVAGSSVAALSQGAATNAETFVLLVAALGYLGGALLALRIPRTLLGPDLASAKQAVREAVHHVFRGLVDGGRHVLSRRPATLGLAAIGVQRFFYSVQLVATILLYRNYFEPTDPSAALAGIATTVLASGLGFGAAALLTPIAVRRMRKETWIVLLFMAAAFALLVPGAFYTEPSMLVAAFVLGLAAQGIKICVDTLVQENVDDVYRGRVFSFYDVIFNVVFVGAAAFAAVTLPPTGRSYAILALSSATYIGAAAVYARLTGIWPRPQPRAYPESSRLP
ncbi:MFS transporter [Actinopolymorpha alba]|uniref:MFS transporter n=1 Tax=Actinopolymorpha alba TaxID=533267 RepID=UPI000367D5EF|nr:MFS transporter [Actinopolymorpha alba]